MIVLYLSKLALELLKRAEALMLIAFTQVNNAASFRFPSDNANGDSVVVFEPSVKFSHKDSPLRRHTPTIAIARLWLQGTQRPDTMRSYRNMM
jgi:predicted TPR repeat methyltransferase